MTGKYAGSKLAGQAAEIVPKQEKDRKNELAVVQGPDYAD